MEPSNLRQLIGASATNIVSLHPAHKHAVVFSEALLRCQELNIVMLPTEEALNLAKIAKGGRTNNPMATLKIIQRGEFIERIHRITRSAAVVWLTVDGNIVVRPDQLRLTCECGEVTGNVFFADERKPLGTSSYFIAKVMTGTWKTAFDLQVREIAFEENDLAFRFGPFVSTALRMMDRTM